MGQGSRRCLKEPEVRLPGPINNAGGPKNNTAAAALGQSSTHTQPSPQHSLGPNCRALGASRILTQPCPGRHRQGALHGLGHGNVCRKHWLSSGPHSGFLLPPQHWCFQRQSWGRSQKMGKGWRSTVNQGSLSRHPSDDGAGLPEITTQWQKSYTNKGLSGASGHLGQS